MKNSGKYVKATAVFTLAFAASGMMLSGCKVDTQKLTDGIDDISNIVKPYAKEIISENPWNKVTPTGTPIVLPEAAPTETPAPTATPAPTSTPIPTPTPMPERVDFSELIKTDLGNNFTVSSEDFGESYTAEGEDNVISDFKGNRIAVEAKDNPAAQQAINLILNSYYLKAEGIYKEASARAASFYTLNRAADEVYHTEVTFAHSDNGRILSVVVTVSVKQGSKTIKSETKVENFDMLTGQYVNLGTVSDNPSRLKVALINELNKERLAVKKTETGLKNEAEEFLPSESSTDETSAGTDETSETSASGSNTEELILASDVTDATDATETTEETTETTAAETKAKDKDKDKDKDKKKDNKDTDDSSETTAAKETEKISTRIVNYKDIYIVIQTPGATSVTAQILGVTATGEVFTATCDLTPYKDLFNSYGKLVYGL